MTPAPDHWLVYLNGEWDASFENEVAAREHASWMVDADGGWATIYRRRTGAALEEFIEEFIEDLGLRPLELPVRDRLSALAT